MSPRDDASEAQVTAAAPDRSTWLSANAGSGKTRVLTERVARLLLGGTPPQNILCLTYTKAAAGEMQNRLFRTLGAWSMLADADLASELEKIGADGGTDLPRARTLFARAIETPGGLKIQTIHSFCAALLRQFPLEAGVSPQFMEIEDAEQKALLAQIAEGLASDDAQGHVERAANYLSADGLEKLLKDMVSKRAAFTAPLDRKEVLAGLGVAEDYSRERLLAELDPDIGIIQALRSCLKQDGTKTSLETFDKLIELGEDRIDYADLPVLEGLFLYGAKAAAPFGSKAGKFPKNAVRANLAPDVAIALDHLMDRTDDARPKRLALDAADRTMALHGFAREVLGAYGAEKTRRGWLDFDDLIEKAAALLADANAAEWVLYRLDGAIDHILVDEAQDTSPAQWRIIESLTGEFGAGAGARAIDRTLFVVGDKKQSIYSFQGADLEVFDSKKADFLERLRPAGGLADRELEYSFRSAPAILETVDMAFDDGLGGAVSHKAYFDLPGRVDLWPLVEGAEKPAGQDWFDPSERVSEEVKSDRLARGIAQEIQRMIDDPLATHVKDKVRARFTPGDFLILVSGRSGQEDLFQTLIQGCKEAGLPVAGADRMRLESELAVRDLQALLSFLALPEDDLSLAAALRSPLFGWDEDALYRLAADREERYLWAALRNSDNPETLDVLNDLRGRADYLRPFELLERILIRHGGRRRLIGRLGQEAEDGIDALLDLALKYEHQEVPSLTGFVAWLDAESTEVKRALDQSGGMVRIMTVHGAKGLESPVVILPDTTRRDQGKIDPILEVGGIAHWMPSKDNRPPALTVAADDLKTRAEEERRRLLYVAMTRAESWLIVCGMASGKGQTGEWYARTEKALNQLNAGEIETPFGPGSRHQTGDWSLPAADEAQGTDQAQDRPGWAFAPPVPADPITQPISPSDLGGAKALPGEGLGEDDALRRGRLIHRLLEHLPSYPEDARVETGIALLQFGEDIAQGEEARALAQEAADLVAKPELAHLFAADTLAEVAFTAELPGFEGRPVLGIIDRLVPTDTGVLVVDFKTNQVVPSHEGEIPEGVLRQLGAYAEAMAAISPDQTVEVAVLWTQTATLMPVSHENVRSALSRATTS